MNPVVTLCNAFGGWLVSKLWPMSLELAILAAIVLVALRVFRVRSPRLRHLFWCIVLAKPVVTFLIASPISLYGFLRPVTYEAPILQPASITAPTTNSSMRTMPEFSHRPMGRMVLPSAEPESPWRFVQWQGVLAAAWMGVVVLLGLRLAVGCAFVMFLRKSAHVQTSGDLVQMVSSLSRDLGIRRNVTIAVSDVAHGPVLAGVLHPVILLPRSLTNILTPDRLQLIISHELAHVRRWDNLLLVIQRLAEMLFFFHPAVWLCGWMMRREAEAACDDLVVGRFGGASYADSLVRVAEMRYGLTQRLLVNTFAAAESDFSRRVSRILDGRMRKMKLSLTIASIAVLIGLTCLGLPTAREKQAAKQADTKERTMTKSEKERHGTVKREGDKVWIDGVEQLRGWAHGEENTFVGSLGVVMRAIGENVSYDYLMGVSGQAFRVQVHRQPEMSCSAPDAGCGFNCMATAAEALGYTVNEVKADPKKGAMENRDAIVKSIDRGIPVVAMDLDDGMDWGVVAGYSDGGKKLLCRTYDGASVADYAPNKKWPWMVWVLDKKTAVPERKKNLVHSLQLAVELANTTQYGDYISGFTAYEAWIRDLLNDAKYDSLGQEKVDAYSMTHPNCWPYYSLYDARASAARYLRSVATEFAGEASAHITAAAGLYEKIAKTLNEGMPYTPFPHQVGNDKHWTKTMRHAQGDVLQKSLELEKQAVSEIEKALTAEGVKTEKMVGTAHPTGSRIDYSKLVLKGDGLAQDHFSLTVEAAAKLLGRTADYETIFALSTNGFAPALDLGEPDKCWWATARGRGRCLDLVADYLGLNVRHLEKNFSNVPPAPKDEFEIQKWLREHYQKPWVADIRQAQSQGEVLITDREWETKGPHGFYPWCFWGIVVNATDDGAITGACLNGFQDNPMTHVLYLEALRPGQSKLDLHQANLKMLERAVGRIRGDAQPFIETDRDTFGLAAMDLWINQMRQRPYCPGCGDKSWTCARQTAQSVYEGAKFTAPYLRKIAGSFAEPARGPLQSAASHYDRIAALLTPAMTGQGGETYEQIIGNLEKQKAHAAVLQQVKQELALAADEMAKALAAEGVKIEKTGQHSRPAEKRTTAEYPVSRMLENVPDGKTGGPALIGGLTMMLNYCGIKTDRDTVCGDLGMAFILQASDRVPRYDGALDVGWWPLATECVPVLLEQASSSLGAKFDCRCSWDVEEYERDRAAYYRKHIEPAIKASIAAGRPALENHAFWQVVVGYDDQPQPVIGFCPCPSDGKYQVGRLEKPPFLVVTVGERLASPDRKQADIESLKRAVALGRDQIPMPGGYVTGQKAFALWADTLRDTKNLGQARYHANVVVHLQPHRQAAVNYLRAMAKRHSEKMALNLNAAADLYEKALAELANADTSERALIQSTEGRERLAQLVDRMAAIETQAVDRLEQALAAEGVKVEKTVGTAQHTREETTMTRVRRENGKVWIDNVAELKKTPERYNAYFDVLTAALRSMGEPVTYEHLMGLTGYSMHVQFHRTEWCDRIPCGLCGPEEGLAGVRAIGYPIEVIMTESNDEQTVLRSQKAIMDSIDQSRPVPALITIGKNYEFGLVVGYEDGGKHFLCRTYFDKNGQYSRIDAVPWLILVIGQKDTATDPRAGITKSLQMAAANSQTQEKNEFFYGQDAYAKWTSDLANETFVNSLDKQKLPLTKFVNSLCYYSLLDARRNAAKYLRNIQPAFGRESSESLEKAATLYDRIARTMGKNRQAVPEGVKDDATAWNRQDREVQIAALKEVAALDRQAVEQIAAVLKSEGKMVGAAHPTRGEATMSRVKCENGKVWIEGVPSLSWYKGKNCTFIGAMEAATAVTDHPYQYTDLMGWSGLAFRVRWNRGQDGKSWTGCSPIGEMPDEANALEKATGWTFPADWHVDQSEAEKEKFALPKITAAIDAGRPVIAYGSSWDMAVIYGYQDGGKTVLFHDYDKGDNFAIPTGKLIGLEIFLGQYKSPLPEKDAIVQGLSMAVSNWHRGHGDGGIPGRDYLYGPAALTAWIDDLALFDSLTQPQKEKLMHLNQWNFGSLVDARNAAAAFLRQSAEHFNPAAREALLHAADIYEQEVKTFEPPFMKKECFLAKCRGNTLADWTPEIRKREQTILSQVLAKETQAMKEIEKALTAEGIKVQPISEPTQTSAKNK